MHKVLLLLLAFLFSGKSEAQDPVFSWSSANTKPAMQIDVQLLGFTGDGYYVVNKKPASGMEFSPTITVEYFNSKQERVFVKNVTPAKQEDYVNVVYFNQSLYLISALFTKDAGKNVLSATAVNKDGTLGKPVEIGSMNAEKLSGRGLYNVAVSADGSKLLVLSQPNYTKDENEKITLTLYTGAFSKQWSSVQTFPYEWTKAVENTPFVNNQGTAFILKKTDMKGSDNSYSIFSFEGKELKEYKIAMDGKKKVATIVQAFAPNGDCTVGGYYTEDSKVKVSMGTALHGMFLHRITHTGASATIAVLTPFEKRKDIIAKDILFYQNNSILLGERYIVSSQAPQRDPSKPMTNENMFARDYSYYGMDIIMDGFDETGKVLYSSKIDKDNTSRNDNGTWVSYFAAVINGKIYIIFNDDKYKYDDKKRIFIAGSPKIVVYATVDPTTGVATETKALLNTAPIGGKTGDMLLRPDVFLKQDESHYIIRAENPSIYRMGLVGF